MGSIKQKACKHCGRDDHTSLMCFQKSRVPFRPRTVTKGYQNMQAAYAHWHRDNPPDDNGYWYCFYGGEPLTLDVDRLKMGVQKLTLDHYHTRSRHPELKYDPKNLVPSCLSHNSLKGSMDGDDYIGRLKGD